MEEYQNDCQRSSEKNQTVFRRGCYGGCLSRLYNRICLFYSTPGVTPRERLFVGSSLITVNKINGEIYWREVTDMDGKR